MLYFRLRKVHRNDIFNFISESFAKISTGHTCGVTGVLKQVSTSKNIDPFIKKLWLLKIHMT